MHAPSSPSMPRRPSGQATKLCPSDRMQLPRGWLLALLILNVVFLRNAVGRAWHKTVTLSSEIEPRRIKNQTAKGGESSKLYDQHQLFQTISIANGSSTGLDSHPTLRILGAIRMHEGARTATSRAQERIPHTPANLPSTQQERSERHDDVTGVAGKTRTFSTSEDLLQRWNSAACQGFYSSNSSKTCRTRLLNWNSQRLHSVSNEKGALLSLPQTCVHEDLNKNGRLKAVPGFPRKFLANEVTISHTWKFVYINVRKGGSTTVNYLLRKHFNERPFSCPEQPIGCRVEKGGPARCTSACLNETVLSEYFVFTFVREPVARFYSGIAQAHRRLRVEVSSLDRSVDCEKMRERIAQILQGLIRGHVAADEHLESQALSLSTLVTLQGLEGMPRLDWLGYTEEMRASLPDLFARIAENAGRAPMRPDVELKARVGSEAKAALQACRTPELDAMVRRAYAQDVACFAPLISTLDV